MGVIYILTNPSFPEYVKIGYADDMKKRLEQLNRSECTPFAFRVYATYEVSSRLTDMKIHNVIDRLNPALRSIDNIDGKKRVREFYAMTKEEAYSILEAIAEINGLEKNLHLVEPTEKEKKEEETARRILKNSDFYELGLKNGDVLLFVKDKNIKCSVISNRKVLYESKEYSLSALASELLDYKSVNGFRYFEFEGETLWDKRRKMEGL
jgi:hypothetical protein